MMPSDITKFREGVQLVDPHPFTAQAIQDSVNDFLKTRPEAKGGAMVSVTMTEGVNFVLATKVNDNFIVKAWIGKKWSEPIRIGAQGVYYF